MNKEECKKWKEDSRSRPIPKLLQGTVDDIIIYAIPHPTAEGFAEGGVIRSNSGHFKVDYYSFGWVLKNFKEVDNLSLTLEEK